MPIIPPNLQGGPSQRFTGVTDNTFINELITKLEALEAKQPRFLAAGEVLLANGAAGSETQIKLPKVVDNEAWYSEATFKYTPTKSGLYVATCAFIGTVVMAAGTFADVAIFKNEALTTNLGLSRCIVSTAALTGGVMQATSVFEMNGSTDTLEIVGNSTMAGNKGNTTFSVYRVAI